MKIPLIAVLLSVVSLPVSAAVYKCQSADGQTRYSQTPCPGAIKIPVYETDPDNPTPATGLRSGERRVLEAMEKPTPSTGRDATPSRQAQPEISSEDKERMELLKRRIFTLSGSSFKSTRRKCRRAVQELRGLYSEYDLKWPPKNRLGKSLVSRCMR